MPRKSLRKLRLTPMLDAPAEEAGASLSLGYNRLVTATENSILTTLQSLESAVASMPTANPKPDLRPIFARLDELTRSLPPSTSPDLLHYMHKRSYQKARLFLEGRDAESQAGSCGHV